MSGTIKSFTPHCSIRILENDFSTPDEMMALTLRPIAKNSVKRLPSK